MKTTFGDVPLWGRIEPGKPLLFVIRGAFPVRDHLMNLVADLPNLSVGLVHLPGMHSPFFEVPSVATFARAFDEIVDQFAGPTAVLGSSLGGAVAMAMKSRHIQRRILLDTPLQTAGLWQVVRSVRPALEGRPHLATWVDALLGITPEAVINRDYRGLINGDETVVVAEEPLGEPRTIVRLIPSAVSEADRSTYRAAGCRVIEAPETGHEITADAMALVLEVIRGVTESMPITRGRAANV